MRRLLSSPWVQLHRPVQWIKNVVVVSPLFFGGQAGDAGAILRAAGAVVAFCAISSTGYIWNDVWDRRRDRLHPDKRGRPIASGCILASTALFWSAILLTAALALGVLVSPSLFWIEVVYIIMTAGYTTRLKHVPLLDVGIIAGGFVLRALAGAMAVDVPMSSWLLVCTFLLALVLGFGKRRHELVALGAVATRHRPALAGYSRPLLDGLLVSSAALTVVAYGAYAATTSTVTTNGLFLLSVPIVGLAISRYLFLVFRRGAGGSPEAVLLQDRLLQGAIIGWAVVVGSALIRFQVL